MLPSVVPAKRMVGQRKFCERMIISNQAHRRSVTDLAYNFDAGTRFADPETVARKDLAITLRMEFRKSL